MYKWQQCLARPERVTTQTRHLLNELELNSDGTSLLPLPNSADPFSRLATWLDTAQKVGLLTTREFMYIQHELVHLV